MLGWLFKQQKPFNNGYLPEEDGHQVYFQEFGNPDGKPVLLFHGGPGSCSKPKHATNFNLKTHRIIMFDQRGCGQSLPLYNIENNSLKHLVHDAHRLLAQLSIKKTIVCGGSWGATVCLAFAQSYPQLIEKMICSKVFLARNKDISWISESSAIFYPDIMDALRSPIPAGQDLRDYYAKQMLFGDRKAQAAATKLYGSYERQIGSLHPALLQEEPAEDHIESFKLYMHYDADNYGLTENQILENIDSIKHIPTLIVHNRLDMICPAEQAWLLHKAMPQSKLVIVPDSGHSSALLERTIKQELQTFLGGI